MSETIYVLVKDGIALRAFKNKGDAITLLKKIYDAASEFCICQVDIQ